jgi:hypothetical protein
LYYLRCWATKVADTKAPVEADGTIPMKTVMKKVLNPHPLHYNVHLTLTLYTIMCI